MLSFPMHFKVSASSKSGIQPSWKARAGDHSLSLAIPPEFAGPGGGFSPEDLYALALQNCFIATFKVVAEKSKLQYGEVSVDSTLSVDRNAEGRPWMAAIHMDVTLTGAQDKERAFKLLQKTSEQCMILNSTLTTKTFEFRV